METLITALYANQGSTFFLKIMGIEQGVSPAWGTSISEKLLSAMALRSVTPAAQVWRVVMSARKTAFLAKSALRADSLSLNHLALQAAASAALDFWSFTLKAIELLWATVYFARRKS